MVKSRDKIGHWRASTQWEWTGRYMGKYRHGNPTTVFTAKIEISEINYK